MITGLLNLAVMAVIAIGFAYTSMSFKDQAQMAGPAGSTGFTFMIAPIVVMVFLVLAYCAFVILTALKMMQLEGYRWAIVASILAILFTPGNLIGWAIGVWSLIVLNRAEVHAAFAARERKNTPVRPITSTEERIGIVALVAGVAAILCGLLVAKFSDGNASSLVLISLVLFEVISLACGIAGRRSAAGRVGLIFSAVLLVFGPIVMTLALRAQLHRDFGGIPDFVQLERFVFRSSSRAVSRRRKHAAMFFSFDKDSYVAGPTEFRPYGFGNELKALEMECGTRRRSDGSPAKWPANAGALRYGGDDGE